MTEYTFTRHVWIVGLTNLNERRGCRMSKEAAVLGAKRACNWFPYVEEQR